MNLFSVRNLSLALVAVCLLAPGAATGVDLPVGATAQVAYSASEAFPGAARLAVSAWDVTGRPLTARITVYRLLGDGEHPVATGRTTGNEGFFFLPPGEYRVEVASPDGAVRSYLLSLTRSQARSLRVVFE